MDRKIFLQGFDGKLSSNTSEGLNVQFKGKRKLLPLNDVADVVSQYDQYREEREKCNIIRLTCQVNPICSNVLFNRITEIVKNDGSCGVSFINYGIYGRYSDDNCTYRDYDDNTLFSGVLYKPNNEGATPRPMEFWSGGTMHYQGNDESINDSSQEIFPSSDSHPRHSFLKTVSNSSIHPTNAIRDSQLSNTTDNFEYHCGLDIFNNHLIRSRTFKTVCRMPYMYTAHRYTDNYSGFNTIVDLMRDVSGYKVVEKIYFPPSASVENNAKLVVLHLYEYDDVLTFNECIRQKLISKYNGWVGFENKSKIKSYFNFQKSEEMEIERPLMYMAGGDFVDMYPSRDLYSFVPKYNSNRKRIEKNWNYCVTYPSSSYTPSYPTDPFGDIIESNDGLNSLKAIYFDENTRADNGTTQLVIYGIAKHGLKQGDYVNIYKTYTSQKFWLVDVNGDRVSDYFNTEIEAQEEWDIISADSVSDGCSEYDGVEISGISSDTSVTINEKILDNAEVNEIVDEYIFTVFNSSTQISNNWVKLTRNELKGVSDLSALTHTYHLDDSMHFFKRVDGDDTHYYIVNNEYVNIDDSAQRISYKKVVNDIECDYYVRIFSKVPNFKFASGDTSNEYQLYKNNEEVIHQYQDSRYDFESHVSRLAFAKNIYTDNIGEIVFTDDIDISNLHDNLGRPLTSLYMTIVKNNKGYKEWYGYDYLSTTPWDVSQISGGTVEYSHAFGKITCGIKTSDESRFDNDVNSINRITNIGNNGSGYLIGGYINESGRTYTTDDGRIVSINNEEIWYDSETQFWGDLCYYDNYNAIERHIDYIQHRFNTAQRESYNSQSRDYFNTFYYDEIEFDDYDTTNEYGIRVLNRDHCNSFREGYYYIPHYEIPIKTFDKLQSTMPDFLTIREYVHMEQIGENVYQFTTLEQHFLSVGDKAVLYYAPQERYYNLITITGSNDSYRVFTCRVYDEETNEPRTLIPMERVKLYNYRLFKMDNIDAPSYCKVLKDGTCRVIWRNVLNNGFNMSDKTIDEYPFTNGAFYVNRRIELYLRRQDPHNFYGLYDQSDIEGNITDLTSEDNYIKEADIEC